jgi:translocon-associated protein subunit alpha
MNWKLLTLLGLLCFAQLARVSFAQAEPDAAESEEDAKVEEEGPAGDKAGESTGVTKDKDQDEEEEVKTLQPSPDVETYFIFTKPTTKTDLPAAVVVKFLVGFLNKGEKPFIVQGVETSFRYPMDYSFYIQNYTASTVYRAVPPGTEATFDYAFIPSEQYAGRPLGLVVNVNYQDENGTTFFQNAVFNETVNIVEEESAFNPETSFLYVFLACIVVLILLLGQQFLQKMRKKHGMTRPKQTVEMGTTSNGDVDYDWIPKDILNQKNKSPKPPSPRQRKGKKVTGDE